MLQLERRGLLSGGRAAEILAGEMAVEPQGIGTCEVTATDPSGEKAAVIFAVTVEGSPSQTALCK